MWNRWRSFTILFGFFLWGCVPAPIRPVTFDAAPVTTLRTGLVAQLGHANRFLTAMALSHNDKLLISTGSDGNIKLWDTHRRLELRQLNETGDTPAISGQSTAAFSPNDEYAVIGREGGYVSVFRIIDGKKIWQHRFNEEVSAVAFPPTSSDTVLIATGEERGALALWSMVSPSPLWVREFGDRLSSLAVSSQGNYIAAASGMAVWLLDASDGSPVQRLDHVEGVESVAFSPVNDSMVVTGSNATGKTSRLSGQTDTGKPVPEIAQINLWHWSTSDARRTVIGQHAGNITRVMFSSDGERVLSSSNDNSVMIWHIPKGTAQETGPSSPLLHKQQVAVAIFSSDDRTFFTASGEIIRAWESETARLLGEFKGLAALASSVAFSADGTLIATGSWDNSIAVWDGRLGMRSTHWAIHRDNVRSVAFSPSGSLVVAASRDGTASLWDPRKSSPLKFFRNFSTATKAVINRSSEYSFGMRHAEFSADGSIILTAHDEGTVELWESKEPYRSIARFGPDPHRERLAAAVLHPKGTHILTAAGKRIYLWEVHSENKPWESPEFPANIDAISFSPDNRTALIASWDHVFFLDLASRRISPGLKSSDQRIYAARFSPDGKQFIVGGDDTIARLWDVMMRKELCRFQGHSGSIVNASFSPDKQFLLTASADRTVNLWNLGGCIHGETAGTSVHQELCSIISFLGDGGWAVIDRQGRYDAANGGDVEGLHWVVGTEPISLKQLKDRYFSPGLLSKKMGLNPEWLDVLPDFTAPSLHPDVSLSLDEKGKTLEITLRNRGGGIGRVEFSINGIEMIEDARPFDTDPKTSDCIIRIELEKFYQWLKPDQNNRLIVVARNAEGTLSSSPQEISFVPSVKIAVPRNFWGVFIGTSDYSGEKIDLRYAAKDAEEIATIIGSAARNLLNSHDPVDKIDKVNLLVLSTNRTDPGERPTKKNIERVFSELQQASSEDIVFVYLSGHGVAYDDVYHYLTEGAHSTNLNDSEVRKYLSVSSDEIVTWLKKSKATDKKVIVLDSCAAGAAVKSFTETRGISSDQIRALERLKDKTGVHILMGSAADQVSYEVSTFERGLLTHALLKGIKGESLHSSDIIEAKSLLEYAMEEVPRLAETIGVGGIQKPQIIEPKATAVESFPLGSLPANDREKINIKNIKPILLSPRLLNQKTMYDDLNLEVRIRNRLREVNTPIANGSGGAMPVIFVEVDDLPGAIHPSGLYMVDGDKVKTRLILRMDSKKPKEVRIDAEGSTSDLGNLVESIIRKIFWATTTDFTGYE